MILDIINFLDSHYSFKIILFIFSWYSWVKFKTTRFYSIIVIYRNKNKLLQHKLFYLLTQVPLIESEILKMGRKEVFGHLLFYEAALFSDFVRKVILNITQEERTQINLPAIRTISKFINYYKNFNYNNQTLSQYILDEYDKLIVNIRDVLLYTCYENIEVTHLDRIKYARRKSHPELADEKFIVQEIQKEKMKIIIQKYEGIMFVHRNMVKKNIQSFFSSKIRVDDLLDGVMSHCFLPVYKNISETIATDINKINGEFNGIVYGGYSL